MLFLIFLVVLVRCMHFLIIIFSFNVFQILAFLQFWSKLLHIYLLHKTWYLIPLPPSKRQNIPSFNSIKLLVCFIAFNILPSIDFLQFGLWLDFLFHQNWFEQEFYQQITMTVQFSVTISSSYKCFLFHCYL